MASWRALSCSPSASRDGSPVRDGHHVVAPARRCRDRRVATGIVRRLGHRRRGDQRQARPGAVSARRLRPSVSIRSPAWPSRTRRRGLPRHWPRGVRRWESPMSSPSLRPRPHHRRSPSPTLPSPTSAPSSTLTRRSDVHAGRRIDAVEPDEAPDDRARPRRRRLLIGAVVLVVALAAVVAGGVLVDDQRAPAAAAEARHPARRVGALLDARRVDARDRPRLGSMRDVSPFWFNAIGVDQHRRRSERRRRPDHVSSWTRRRRSTANVVPSIVDAMPAGGMAAVLADPTSRAASTSRRSPRSLPTATTTASTSTTNSSPSPTVVRRGRRLDRTGSRSSPNSAPASTPTVAP